MKRNSRDVKLRILVKKESNKYLARSVDLEFMAQGRTVDEAVDRLLITIITTYVAYSNKDLDMFKVHPKADPIFLNIFEESNMFKKNVIEKYKGIGFEADINPMMCHT